MFSTLATLLSPRSSSETARSAVSLSSDRSYRLPSSTYTPPSIVYGSATRPNIELQKPVWEVNGHDQSVFVSGEIEVDMSMFRHGQYILPFSIGIHFTCDGGPLSGNDSDTDDEDANSATALRSEWNQDGPGNYYRHQSFIQIKPRVVVDDICHVGFTIAIPQSLLPSPKNSRVYNVAVKAYELGNPFNVTEPSAARFMVLNRIRQPHEGLDALISSPNSRRISDLASQMNIRMMKRGGRYSKFY